MPKNIITAPIGKAEAKSRLAPPQKPLHSKLCTSIARPKTNIGVPIHKSKLPNHLYPLFLLIFFPLCSEQPLLKLVKTKELNEFSNYETLN